MKPIDTRPASKLHRASGRYLGEIADDESTPVAEALESLLDGGMGIVGDVGDLRQLMHLFPLHLLHRVPRDATAPFVGMSSSSHHLVVI